MKIKKLDAEIDNCWFHIRTKCKASYCISRLSLSCDDKRQLRVWLRTL